MTGAAGADAGGPVADVLPFGSFAAAAQQTLEFLHTRVGMDLWLVTRVTEDRQTAISAHPAGLVQPGMALPWAEGFCSRMVAGNGPRVASVTAAVPAYAEVQMGLAARVGAYLGVPLVGADGALFGTLCGFSLRAQPSTLSRSLPLVEHTARLLATLLDAERTVVGSRRETADAVAAGDRDPLTNVLNRRGWNREMQREEARCRRTSSTASVLVLDLDDLETGTAAAGPAAGNRRLRGAADILIDSSRTDDVVARTGTAEFAVLLAHPAGAADAEVGTADATYLARLHDQLNAAGLPASVGLATREDAEGLSGAWQRAAAAKQAAKAQRRYRDR